MSKDSSVAVFIDVENIHYSTINQYSQTPDWSKLVELCKGYGKLASVQAFGDWVNFSQEVPEIQRNGIQPVFVPLSQSGKSSLDSYLIVSAMKLFFQNQTIDTMILASGDRDYIPLIAELKALGKEVVILAVPNTISADLITIVDNVIPYTMSSEENSTPPAEKQDKRECQSFIVTVLKELEENSLNNRWVNLAHIGLKLKKRDPGFSHKAFGYGKLADMLGDIPLVEIRYDNHEKSIALARTLLDPAEAGVEKTLIGTVIKVKDGYGFIKPDLGTDHVFFHSSNVTGCDYRELSFGDKVSYGVYNTERGENAENVCKV